MVGAQPAQPWKLPSRVGRIHSPYRPEPDQDADSTAEPATISVAFAGRVSTYDMQDPTLSLPRQLSSSTAVLPDNAVITAYYYDIETGTSKDLSERGRGDKHEQFDIPFPRAGGIQDLLDAAARPDRPFAMVVCESIERIARDSRVGTQIEYLLDRAGVRLLPSDERFQLTTSRGGRPKTATQILTRRVKQGVAEWYVLDMLEKSWDGFVIHTETGFNVGKPCYGYQADGVPHPVPAKRAKGIKKTFLKPDPDQAPVVQRIFAWRVQERLGYQAIADRLNTDLASNPPPSPVRPDAAVGHWTASNVRDVLTNPKHTGHMVWNRHARKKGHNRANPVENWVWSQQPVHEPLVDMETFITAQEVSGHRFGSRSTSTRNTRHPQTKHTYLLRTFLFCGLCGRRMLGKTRREHGYYVCAPKKDYIPDGHPAASSFWVREDALVQRLNEFLNQRVFGPHRGGLLAQALADLPESTRHEHADRVAALQRAIVDVDAKSRRLIRNLEIVDDPDQDFIRDINTRRAELRARKAQLETELVEAETEQQDVTNPGLLEALPTGPIDVTQLPDDLARRLFEALRLEIRYDPGTRCALFRITLTGDTTPAAQQAAHDAVVLPFTRRHGANSASDGTPDTEPAEDPPVPILVVHPALHNANLSGALVPGELITLPANHAKVRRDGYRAVGG